MRADRYSRMVAWLKVILPLAALGILSTLFLLSRSIDPGQAIPFADKEVQERLRDQQVTGPFFSGTTADGDQLSFSATKLTTPGDQVGTNIAHEVILRTERASGLRMLVSADRAELNMADNEAVLTGDVRFTTSTGYEVRTAELVSQLSTLEIVAPQMVRAAGPIGKLDAGGMTLTIDEGTNDAQLLFTDGVKLVYTPNKD